MPQKKTKNNPKFKIKIKKKFEQTKEGEINQQKQPAVKVRNDEHAPRSIVARHLFFDATKKNTNKIST